MGFNDLFKKTIEIGKELKPTLPINYRKQFWNNFVQQVVKKGEVIKENNNFTDLNGKEFSFKTKEYSFDFNDKGFMLSKIDTEEKIEKNLYVTNPLKIVENMTGFGLNKIKFILADTENITENIFYEFIVSPENFENYVFNLWNKFSEPFSINFKEDNKELNSKRIKLLIDSWDEKENVVSETKVELEEENDEK